MTPSPLDPHRHGVWTSPKLPCCGRSPTGTARLPVAVAVAWALRNRVVDGAIVGFRRPDQVDPLLVAAGLELTDEDVDEIEKRA